MKAAYAIIGFASLLLLQAAGAQTRPSASLLDKLAKADTVQEAQFIEKDVWDAWLYEGGATTDILMERGLDAQENGDNSLARDMYDRVILIEPDYAEVWHRRAALFFADGKYDEALADFEEALEREPRHFGAWTGLGVLFEAIDQNAAAIAAYREALAIYPYAGFAMRAEKRLAPLVDGRAL